VNPAAAESAPDGLSAPAADTTITVYKPKHWGADSSLVELDGIPIAELGPGEYVNLTTTPGSHEVYDYRAERITVDAKPGQTYFIKSGVGFGITGPRSHLALVASETAAKEISCCKSVPPAAWIVSEPGMRLDEGPKSPVMGRDLVLGGAEWMPNIDQEIGVVVYHATIVVDAQAMHIQLNTHRATDGSVSIPLSSLASAENGHHKRNCWLTIRRKSGHVDEIRAGGCSAVLSQFGEAFRAKLLAASNPEEVASRLGPIVARYNGYRMLDSSGPACPFPGYAAEHDGGPFEVYDRGLVWAAPGRLPTVLPMDEIAEVMPLHHVLTMTWLPLRTKGGACMFLQLHRNDLSVESELVSEARAMILKRVSSGAPEVDENQKP
jgi:hypothetical protein